MYDIPYLYIPCNTSIRRHYDISLLDQDCETWWGGGGWGERERRGTAVVQAESTIPFAHAKIFLCDDGWVMKFGF